jgi:hypothetical protein
MEVSIDGVPIDRLDGVFDGKSIYNMDDDWGHLNFRKSLYGTSLICV